MTTIPDWILGDIPQRMRGAAIRYIMDGIQPGSFLTAVFENNLYQAIACADDENRYRMCDYAMMLNRVPFGCWGSREKVTAWMKAGGMKGIQGGKDEPSNNHET